MIPKRQKREQAADRPISSPDRVIGAAELGQIIGKTRQAIYHLRSHRPEALPPALGGPIFGSSASYLLSTTMAWLNAQQEATQRPAETSVDEPDVARTGRPRARK